jgi:prevent-host-death family protein
MEVFMLSVKEDTTIVGITELRKMIPEILKKIKQEKVILTRRNRPIGILVDYEEYERMEKMIEALEDQILGQLAKERAARKDKRTIDLEEAERRVGLK